MAGKTWEEHMLEYATTIKDTCTWLAGFYNLWLSTANHGKKLTHDQGNIGMLLEHANKELVSSPQ